MDDSKKRGPDTLKNFEEKVKNSFSMIKEDINKISSKVNVVSIDNDKRELVLEEKIKQLNVILSSLNTLKNKFAIEVKRYKEETRILRELIKDLDRRLRDVEMGKEIDEENSKFWASWINP